MCTKINSRHRRPHCGLLSSADGPDLPDLEGVISEAESIKYSTPLFERMKSSFVRLRDAIQGLDSGLVNGKAVRRGKDFIADDSIAYDALESALLQVDPVSLRCSANAPEQLFLQLCSCKHQQSYAAV